MLNKIVNLFPWILLTVTGFAFLFPAFFVWFQGSWITYSLGGIMLGMGLTLKWSDFLLVFKLPGPILLGTVLQYTIMPLLGWGLGYIFSLPNGYAVGLILVASCPGGTASNVITFLARANLPLSVTLTTVSTSLAIFFTPLIASFLIGSRLEIDPIPLLLTTVKVILVPIGLGVVLQTFVPTFANRLSKYSPVFSVILISMIVSSIIAQGKNQILASDFRIFLSVFLLHVGGFLLGFLLTKLFYQNASIQRTISIEVGMQNSGLGAVLAKTHFVDPSTAIPSALSSLMHSLIGSFLAGIWRKSEEN
ncbi:MAG: bile acid:sodium symporter family protein [Leptospira sp.]|nr:bile acid:sodium symporter family protein [Leptospira sp.]